MPVFVSIDCLLKASKFCQMWPWGSVSSAVNSEGHFSLCAIAGMFLLGHSKATGGDSYRLCTAASTLSVDLCHWSVRVPSQVPCTCFFPQRQPSGIPVWLICVSCLVHLGGYERAASFSRYTGKLDFCSASSLVSVTGAEAFCTGPAPDESRFAAA